jgi:uncharacterized cupin superfamily protein
MKKVEVVKNPSKELLDSLGVRQWPIWTKEVSEFPWFYDSREVCLFLEGEVVVVCDNGDTVSFGKGDLVTFPEGLGCTWKVKQPVKKHYQFD